MVRSLIIFFIGFIALGNFMEAQFNFQVGYNLNWSEFKQTNDFIDTYNHTHPELSTDMCRLHVLHGITLGLRYQFKIISVVCSWSNQSNNRYSIQPGISAGVSDFKRQLNFINNNYNLGIESALGVFSIGSSLNLLNYRIKAEESSKDEKLQIFNSNNLGATIYSQLDFVVNSRMAIILRINYSFLFNSYNINNLNSYLNISTAQTQGEKINQFGISLIFSNGKQIRY